jgi:hypothetical protein
MSSAGQPVCLDPHVQAEALAAALNGKGFTTALLTKNGHVSTRACRSPAGGNGMREWQRLSGHDHESVFGIVNTSFLAGLGGTREIVRVRR